MLQGCIQISGVFRPKQVVSAGTQTEDRVWSLRLDSRVSSSVSHAHSKWLPSTCCSVSYSNRDRLFNPEFDPAFRNTQYITNRGTKCQLCTPPHSEPLCLRASVLKKKMRILCGKILRNVTNSLSSFIQIIILYILSERRNYKIPKIIHHFAQL